MEWIAMLGTDVVQQLIANGKEQAPLKGSRRERDFEPVCLQDIFTVDERHMVAD